jgi:micrococcal nuclease
LVVEDAAVRDRYNYEATVISVYDADTVTLSVDLGFGTSVKQRFRLSRINGPEVRGVERERGIVSREYLRKMLPFGKVVGVRTIKDSQEKYGRYLAEIFDGEICLNDLLVQAGMAEYRLY